MLILFVSVSLTHTHSKGEGEAGTRKIIAAAHENSGLLTDHSFSMSQLCDIIATEANAVMGRINRSRGGRFREGSPWAICTV